MICTNNVLLNTNSVLLNIFEQILVDLIVFSLPSTDIHDPPIRLLVEKFIDILHQIGSKIVGVLFVTDVHQIRCDRLTVAVIEMVIFKFALEKIKSLTLMVRR
jgi:hypothetical protein